MYLFIARWDPGGLSCGGTHERVCRWEPVPLAVGHDPAYLLWNSSYMGSEHYLLSLSFYNKYAYMLFAMGAYEGGCPCAASATDALWGGGCPCAHALLRYFSQQSTLAPNSFLTRFSIVPQQTGFSQVLPPNKFPHTLWGWGCWGQVYLHILFSIWVTEPGLVPAPGLGACVPGGVRACVAPFRGVFPVSVRAPVFLC
jgi:hypothetical protein